MSKYEESLSFIKGSKDDLFPDWLFKPAFNDFDDDYYEASFVDTKLETDAKKIRRRYNDYFQWEEAMFIYENYMNKMVEKWGSMKIITNSVEHGTMPDYIPPKPRLKNTKKNRRILRGEISPSRRRVELPVSPEETIAIARQLFPDAMGDDLELEEYKMNKKEKLAYERMERRFEQKNRRANMYRDVGTSRGTDFIVEYLNQAKQGVYTSSGFRKKKKPDEEENGSLVAVAKEIIRRETTPQWIIDDEELPETTMEYGRIVNRREMEEMEIYKILYEEGFNVIGSMSGRMDKRSVKMIRAQIGATEPMTKKEMRKLKKRNKRDQARIQRRRDESNALTQSLLKNKIRNGRDANGNITLRMHDLFPYD